MWARLIQKITGRLLKIPKRARYVISSAVGGLLLFAMVGVPYEYTGFAVGVLVLCSYVLTWFALLEDVKGVEWGTLFILPIAWTACWYLSFYLLSMRFLVRLLFSMTYPIVFYVIVSAMNIFNVGVEKNIQLRRAAQAANSFIMVFTYYLFIQVLLSFALNWYITASIAGICTFVFGIQYFWALSPSTNITKDMKNMALYQSMIMMFTIVGLSFIPLASETSRPVIVAGVYYVFGGILEVYKDEVLLRQKMKEYMPILLLLVVAIILTIRW